MQTDQVKLIELIESLGIGKDAKGTECKLFIYSMFLMEVGLVISFPD